MICASNGLVAVSQVPGAPGRAYDSLPAAGFSALLTLGAKLPKNCVIVILMS